MEIILSVAVGEAAPESINLSHPRRDPSDDRGTNPSPVPSLRVAGRRRAVSWIGGPPRSLHSPVAASAAVNREKSREQAVSCSRTDAHQDP